MGGGDEEAQRNGLEEGGRGPRVDMALDQKIQQSDRNLGPVNKGYSYQMELLLGL